MEKQVNAGVDVIISHPKKVETAIDLLDFPTIVWMSPHYSVYTVLQASRRSWRIGQTKPVKVYYFAYADTIQEQALYLVAAKVAAALRVNGDTIADDSGQGTGLAELDGITGNDIVATLARIVTGDTEVSTQSLQQAFAEANASLRQANTLIGEYSIADDDEDVESQSALETIGQRPLPISGNGQPVNGPTRQPSLFSGNQAKPNGTATTVPLNGNGMLGDNGTPTQQEEVMPPGDSRPSVPRPRLLIGQLGAK